MLLRFAFFALGLGIVVFAVMQLIMPAILDKPALSWFRREGRLERAKRLKTEALERKAATLAEIEAIQIEAEAKKMKDEAFTKLTGGDKA
jgi:hypothetical protein